MPADLRTALTTAAPADTGSADVDAAWRRARQQRRLQGISGVLALVVVVATSIVLTTGSDQRRISTASSNTSPEAILAARGDQLVELNLDGGIRRVVASLSTVAGEGPTLSLSPDGASALTTLIGNRGECPGSDPTDRSGYGLSHVDLQTGAATAVDLPATAKAVIEPTFSPDGQRYAYIEYQCQPPGPSTLDTHHANALVVRDAIETEIFRLALPLRSPDDGHHLEVIGIAGWEADGAALLALVQHEPTAELWRIPTQGDPATKLPTSSDVIAASVAPLGNAGRWVGIEGALSSTQPPRLVEYDPHTATVQRPIFEWSSLPTDAGFQVIDSDPTGQHLLLAAYFNGGPQVLYRWSQGDAEPTKVVEHVTAAAWLPSPDMSAPSSTTTTTSMTAANEQRIEVDDVVVRDDGYCTDGNATPPPPPGEDEVPCTQLHTSEKFATFTVPGDFEPDDEILGPPAGELCNLLLELFTGTPMDEQSRYGVLLAGGLTSVPGNAHIECIAQSSQGGALDPTTGSARGALAVTWDRFPEWNPETGAQTAIGFNDFVTERQPSWARSPFLAAWMLAQLRHGLSSGESIAVQQHDLDEVRTRVVVTLSNLPDDSTGAMRYEFLFERAPDGLVRFVSGNRTHRCHPGRGHQDFTTEPCV
ncbi:MAG: hypothetical protein WEA75_07560 [Acidimicrobiia bacterium]